MKERLAQLTSRYKNYSARERNLFKICAAAMCCAVIYYGGVIPLDTMIKSSQSVLIKQKQTLNWMRDEINKNHLQARVVKTNNPRSVVEISAKEIHVALTDVRQDGQSMSCMIDRINVYELKNWLREINFTSGIRLEGIDLTPVDHVSDVKAQIKLTWAKTA